MADDSESSSAVGRLLNSALGYSGLFVGVPLTDEQLGVVPEVANTEAAIRRLADGGGAVLLGRAGVFVLQNRDDVFHVRLDGAVEARRRAAMVHEGIDYKTASRRQQDADHARRAYISHFYPRAGAWEDIRHYHMVLDSTVISMESCVEIIARAAKERFAGSATNPRGEQ